MGHLSVVVLLCLCHPKTAGESAYLGFDDSRGVEAACGETGGEGTAGAESVVCGDLLAAAA